MLEDKENEKVIMYSPFSSKNTFNIISKSSHDVPNIVFRISDNSLILSNIFLKNKGIGTGTYLIGWLINFANSKQIFYFKITFVKAGNKIIEKIARRYNMKKIQDGEMINYYLILPGKKEADL